MGKGRDHCEKRRGYNSTEHRGSRQRSRKSAIEEASLGISEESSLFVLLLCFCYFQSGSQGTQTDLEHIRNLGKKGTSFLPASNLARAGLQFGDAGDRTKAFLCPGQALNLLSYISLPQSDFACFKLVFAMPGLSLGHHGVHIRPLSSCWLRCCQVLSGNSCRSRLAPGLAIF